MKEGKDLELQFSAGKEIHSAGGFPGAVQKSLAEFQRQSPHQLRRGNATVIATVSMPEANAYFVVVLGGPFRNLDELRTALAEVPKGQLLDHMGRVGIE